MEDPELRDDLLLDGGLYLEMDHLLGDNGASRLVAHTVYHTAVSGTCTHINLIGEQERLSFLNGNKWRSCVSFSNLSAGD